MAAAAVSQEDYDVDFEEEPSTSAFIPTNTSISTSPGLSQTASSPLYADAFEKTIIAPPSSTPPPIPRRVSFTETDDYRLTQMQQPATSASFTSTQPMDSSAYTYSSSPAMGGSPALVRVQSMPPAESIPSLSLASLLRSQSEQQPAYTYQPQTSARAVSAGPATSAAPSSLSARAARIQSLLTEFDSKFLVTDPVTRRQSYPSWAVPYAREMLDKLDYVRRMERGQQPPPAAALRAAEQKRPSLTRADSASRPVLHARYDSILDQYYPEKREALQSTLTSAPIKRSASTTTTLSSLSSSLKKTLPRPAFSAHSNCVGHSHGRHSTAGTEEPSQRIRVTKLHSAMTEQINLLSGSLREAWEKIEEHEARGDEGRGVKEEVEEEMRYMREWREWNRARMAELVGEMQRVMREQEEGQARVAVIMAEQVELRAKYDEARARMEDMRALHEREASAWQERLSGVQGRERDGREEEARVRRERDEYERAHASAHQRLLDMQQRMRQLEVEREATQAQLLAVRDGHDGSRRELLDKLAALQQSTAALQSKAQALEANNAELSSTHSTLRDQHATLSSTHSALLSNHTALSSQHQATATLLSTYQAELQQAQKAQAELQSMLKVEGEQARSWREQCEALEAKLRDAEADAGKAKPSVQSRPGAAVVQQLVPRLVSAHYRKKLRASEADVAADAGGGAALLRAAAAEGGGAAPAHRHLPARGGHPLRALRRPPAPAHRQAGRGGRPHPVRLLGPVHPALGAVQQDRSAAGHRRRQRRPGRLRVLRQAAAVRAAPVRRHDRRLQGRLPGRAQRRAGAGHGVRERGQEHRVQRHRHALGPPHARAAPPAGAH